MGGGVGECRLASIAAADSLSFANSAIRLSFASSYKFKQIDGSISVNQLFKKYASLCDIP